MDWEIPKQTPYVPVIKELERIQPRPGDVFVMHSDRALTPQQREQIQQYWKRMMEKSAMGDHALLILDNSLKLSVANPEGLK